MTNIEGQSNFDDAKIITQEIVNNAKISAQNFNLTNSIKTDINNLDNTYAETAREWAKIPATSDKIGMVKPGANLSVKEDGTLNADTYSQNQIDNKLLSKADTTSIPTKTSDLNNDSNYVTQSYLEHELENLTPTIQPATASTLGGVKVGSGINVDADGTISTSSRNIGEIVSSTIPLTDAGLHLLDGALIQGGIYSAFVDYIADLYTENPGANYFAPSSTTWTQPVLSANGTLGGDSFAVSASSVHSTSYDTYMAFDNSSSTQWLTLTPASVSFPVNLIVYNPIALNCTSINITNRLTYSSYFTTGNVYGSNDNSTWTLIQAFTNSVSAPNAKWTINLSNNTEYYKYYKIEFTSGVVDPGTSTASYGLTQVDLIATRQTSPEEWWQQQVTQYGVCGKFVYDSVNNTVRLPKYSNKIYTQELDATAPVVGNGMALGIMSGSNGRTTIGMGLFGTAGIYGTTGNYGKALGTANSGREINLGYTAGITTDATKSGLVADLSNITTSLDGYYYIVIATSTKTDIEVDIDEVATDLNGKADVDLTNTSPSSSFATAMNTAGIRTIVETYQNGYSMYRVWSDGWCEQAGYSASTGTIQFLKVFASPPYVTFGGYTSTLPYISSSGNASQMTVAGGGYFYWKACGYLATT